MRSRLHRIVADLHHPAPEEHRGRVRSHPPARTAIEEWDALHHRSRAPGRHRARRKKSGTFAVPRSTPGAWIFVVVGVSTADFEAEIAHIADATHPDEFDGG